MKKKTDVISIKVVKKHYDAAVKAQDGTIYTPLTTTCLVAQAVRAVFPRKSVTVYHRTASIGKGISLKQYDLDAAAQKLIKRFDGRQRKELRASLPVTVKLTLQTPASFS